MAGMQGPSACALAEMDAPHLPDACVKHIAHYLVQGEPPGNTFLNLLAMCGVCQQWRTYASEIEPGVCVGYDALENTFSANANMLRFRKLSPAQKESVFLSAARLFQGYTDVSLSGEGVTDRLLEQVAVTAGPHLVKLRLHACNAVTDAGLTALVSQAERLESITLEDLTGTNATPAMPSHSTSMVSSSATALPSVLPGGDLGGQSSLAALSSSSARGSGGGVVGATAPSPSALSARASGSGHAAVLAANLSTDMGLHAQSSSSSSSSSQVGAGYSSSPLGFSAAASAAAAAALKSAQMQQFAALMDPVVRTLTARASAAVTLAAASVTGAGGAGARGGGGNLGDVAAQAASSSGRSERIAAVLAAAMHSKICMGAAGGRFLVTLLDSCPRLKSVHLSGMPSLNWGPTKLAALCWGNKAITKLHLRGVNLDGEVSAILSKLPNLTQLEIDGPARNVRVAAIHCPVLTRLSYQVGCRLQLEEALEALVGHSSGALQQLELIIRNFTLGPECLRLIGMLPVVELRLDSYIYKQQPTLSRSSYSHVDNEGVKGLVDAICNRWSNGSTGDMQPLKLSLCGATALTHDAVSALLRLPVLTELDIGGCCRITAMDKMRLVAKVRAGREMLESGRRPSMRSSRFPGLLM